MASSVLIFVSLIFFHNLVLLSAQQCPSLFDCGKLGTIHFPFTTTERHDCGLLPILGCDNHDPNSSRTITLNGKFPLAVLAVLGQSRILFNDVVLHRLLQSRKCEAFSYNLSLPPSSPLASFHVLLNVTLYRCNRSLNVSPSSQVFIKYACPDDNIDIYYKNASSAKNEEGTSSLSACSIIKLPRKDLPDDEDPFTFVASAALLEVQLSDDCDKCNNEKGGRCQLDSNNNFHCSQADERSSVLKLRLVLGMGLGGLGVLLLGLVIKVYSLMWKKQNRANQMIECFLKKHGSLRIRRYSFLEIKKVTKNFQNKLGHGGYGSVYKGQLLDGRLVAVKLLVESKGNGEEFINEVASISSTSHVNIVTLLGFCIEGSNRALIYEFMSNGSLEKFIHKENVEMLDRQLDCKTLYDIAIGVAQGLEYLHRGCNTKILHFDIKPHNILLDEHFCPKTSDFGLAKVCLQRESTVSLSCARGTIGYIAPEIFSRNFGVVSHKSDVYSYGMMVLEIIGGRINTNVEVNCSSEIYFPHWIYKHVELNQELQLRCIKNEIDKERAKKIILIGLWCIQTDPTNRPTMTKVLEMLEGSLESLQIPPKPYLSSPLTSPAHYSNTCTS